MFFFFSVFACSATVVDGRMYERVRVRAHYNISRGRSHKSARRIIISHYGTYTRVHLLNSTYAIGYNVPFLSTIKSNANHLAGRTVHLVSPVEAARARASRHRIHYENRSFRSATSDENNGNHFSTVDNHGQSLVNLATTLQLNIDRYYYTGESFRANYGRYGYGVKTN